MATDGLRATFRAITPSGGTEHLDPVTNQSSDRCACMRAVGPIALILLASCAPGTGSTAGTPTIAATATPRTEGACQIPVWWGVANSTDIGVALISYPDGAVKETSTLPASPQSSDALASFQFYGATYLSPTHTWLRFNRALLSPDTKQYVYWTSSGISDNQVHILDVATSADHVVYVGSTLYFPIAFEPDGIYMVQAVAPRQGAFKDLYRLSPDGGTPQLVTGSDRHMYQWGWLMIADGAAWGIDNRVEGNGYIYSILRLDLATSQVTQWFEAPTMFWPEGVDGAHRLFAASSDQLIRIDQPGQSFPEDDPGPVSMFGGPGATPTFASDARGAWLAGTGGVWLYTDSAAPKLVRAGPGDAAVSPAGPCA